MTAETRGDHSPVPGPRIALIDALRGTALAAMFSYHFVWDLGFFGFIAAEIPMLPEFKIYGHVIASTFLALVGISLVLAQGEKFARRRFFERLAKITAAAAAITLVTLYVFPDDFIFFGILHCIVLGSVAALPFLRAPLRLVLVAAAVALALPLVVASPMLDAPQYWWLGLGTTEPRSNDWRPFLPWFGMVLLGIAFARAARAHGLPSWVVSWHAGRPASRGLVWGGRHSLILYLVHQPVFLALLYVAAQLTGVRPQAEEAPFLNNCESQCVATGATSAYCGNVCRCIVDRAQSTDLWQRMLAPTPDRGDEERFRTVTRDCARDERPNDDP